MTKLSAAGFVRTYKRLAMLALGYLVVLTASRLLLIAMHSDRIEATGGLGFILAQGLRFDIMLVGLVLGPVAVFKPVFHLAPALAGIGRWLGAVYVGVMTSLAFFVEASTSAFIHEFDSRPNYLFVAYLQYPEEVFATVSAARPFSLLSFTILAALAGWAAARWLRRDPQWTTRATVMTCLVAMPLAAALCVGMVRSTLDHRPVNASVAAFSADSLVNQLPLNSPYTVIFNVCTNATATRSATGSATARWMKTGCSTLSWRKLELPAKISSPRLRHRRCASTRRHSSASGRSWIKLPLTYFVRV